MAGYEAPLGGWFYSTRHDARYPRFVMVHYPLHPLHSRGELQVRQCFGSGDVEQYLVEVEREVQAVPVWMTVGRRCAQMTTGFEPLCSMASYLALLSLIRSTVL